MTKTGRGRTRRSRGRDGGSRVEDPPGDGGPDEAASFIAETVAELASSVPVVKAFRVDPDFDLKTLNNYPGAFAFLFDAALTGQYGGTGHTTDWDVARRATVGRRIILAGGLNVENVAAAVRIVRPYGIDVASGVESGPGKKDHGLLREFIEEVRRAERK